MSDRVVSDDGEMITSIPAGIGPKVRSLKLIQ